MLFTVNKIHQHSETQSFHYVHFVVTDGATSCHCGAINIDSAGIPTTFDIQKNISSLLLWLWKYKIDMVLVITFIGTKHLNDNIQHYCDYIHWY